MHTSLLTAQGFRHSRRPGQRQTRCAVVCCLICAIALQWGCGGDTPGRSAKAPDQPSDDNIEFAVQPALVPSPPESPGLLVHFVTQTPTQASYRITAQGGQAGIAWQHQAQGYIREHYQALPLQTGANTSLHIDLEGAGGQRRQIILPIPRSKLDAADPKLLWHKDAELPPYTALSLVPRKPASTKTAGLLLVFDRAGHLLWRYQHTAAIEQILQLSPYALTLVTASGALSVDLLGGPMAWLGGQAQQTDVAAAPGSLFVTSRILQVQRLHPRVLQLPDGHSLVSSDLVAPNPQLLELNPNGGLVQRWPLKRVDNAEVSAPNDLAPVGSFSVAHDPLSQTIAVANRHTGAVDGISRNGGQGLWQLSLAVSDEALPTIQSAGFTANGDLLIVASRSSDSDALDLLRYAPPAKSPGLVKVAEASLQVEHTAGIQTPFGYAQLIPANRDSEERFWLLADNGQTLTDINLARYPEAGFVQTVAQLDEATAQRWAIRDALPLFDGFTSTDLAFAARRATQAASDPAPAGGPRAASVSFYGLSLAPDLNTGIADISGTWDITIGDPTVAPTQQLHLTQDNAVVVGDLEGQSLTGLLKGNTFSTTYRVGFGKEQSKFKYRGLVDASESYMEGHVGLFRDGQLLDIARWEARKR